MIVVIFFFFKQKTAYEMRISDWSSDVCSSDLTRLDAVLVIEGDGVGAVAEAGQRELCHRRRLRVVVSRIADDDRVVQDDAETGIPAAVLERELPAVERRSEEHTSEHQSLMLNSYAVL